MKVRGTSGPEAPVATQHTAKAKAAAPAERGAPPTRVKVSGQAQALAESRAPEQPDEARIARLKAAIDSGTLKTDAGAIADAMLREERG